MSTCTTHRCPLYLFLLLCSLSMHACDARSLAVVDRNKPSNKFHFTNKRTNADSTVVPKVESFSSSKPVLEVTKGSEITVDETEIGITKEGSPQQYHTKVTKMKSISSRKMKGSASTATGQTTASSDQQVSVSWLVPRKKRGIRKQPGFNLDYSPPKTHPPSHN
ncbi:hypothetical protein M0R45_034806 [Rubus argutus]|uniref:Uncharacterized protein n=1 Tax=Rubus argutus TaxID=59490 RepID=A0AAW1VVK7_RUBAR